MLGCNCRELANAVVLQGIELVVVTVQVVVESGGAEYVFELQIVVMML